MTMSCDCGDPANDNPLCDPSNKTTQVRAKAYPALRELSALRGLGPKGVVASACPKQVTDASAADYGYRPAVNAILERLTGKVGGQDQCLPRAFPVDKLAQVPG